MRLWHKSLIPYLPRKQLLSQWRECCCIAKLMREKGTPNHILVNKILDYPLDHFYSYARLVEYDMRFRGYKVDFEKFYQYLPFGGYEFTKDAFSDWHNERYLTQCYYNLQEKYDCGGISESEWRMVDYAYKCFTGQV